MSAGVGNSVERFDFTEDGMEHDFYGKYVRHEDYAKLEQQRAALVEALKKLTISAIQADSCGELSEHIDGSDIDSAVQALRAAGVVL